MFYKLKVQDHIRVPPAEFDKDLKEAIFAQIRKKYDGFISKTIGVVLDVVAVDEEDLLTSFLTTRFVNKSRIALYAHPDFEMALWAFPFRER